MKRIERIALKIGADKEQQKRFAKMNAGRYCSYEVDLFIRDADEFIRATKNGSLMCVIQSVSASGMSRVLTFHSFGKSKNGRYYYRQYWGLFKALGYTESRDGRGFSISGCGMDMVFATHYDIIHRLHRLGFMTTAQRDTLCQQTPTTF